jgi:hypothetical protein
VLTKLTLTSVNVAEIQSSRDAEPAQRSTVSLNPAHKHTADPYTRLTPGAAGTVTGYDDRLGQLAVARDDGCTLAMLLRDGDQVRVITPAAAPSAAEDPAPPARPARPGQNRVAGSPDTARPPRQDITDPATGGSRLLSSRCASFQDDTRLDVETVIWATGFRSGYS